MAKQEYNKDAKRKEAATPQESRQQQKKQRIERVLAQPSGELKLAARKLWETLRQRDLEASVRSQKMTEMMALLSGHIKEITFKHDMSRVLQTCLKYGTAKQRDQIAEELRGGFVELAKSTYGRHIVLRLLKLSNRFRGEIIESFYGQVRKLIKHKDAGMVVEECYATYANARQRWLLSAEMYGNEFAVFKDDQLKSLDEVLAKNPQKRQPAMLSLKGALTPLLEKATVGQSIVHRALLDFLRHADHPQRMEMIETMRELVVEILHTRDGAHAGMLCLLHGTAKDRKAIVKSIKPFAERVAKEEYGHAVILQAMDCVDDTVFVNKTLVPELLSNAHELLADKYGRRVILYVLAGRCPQYVGSEALKVLEAGDSVRAVTSKKDPGARQRELAGPVSERLLLWVAGNADTAIFDPMPSQA
ncbi:Pumilio y domain member 6, partial [Linderina pennispora]